MAPREAIAAVIDSAHSAVAADLLARILKQPPVFLEQLVLRLLVKMGYGGLEAPTEHLGAPGRPSQSRHLHHHLSLQRPGHRLRRAGERPPHPYRRAGTRRPHDR